MQHLPRLVLDRVAHTAKMTTERIVENYRPVTLPKGRMSALRNGTSHLTWRLADKGVRAHRRRGLHVVEEKLDERLAQNLGVIGLWLCLWSS